ncbi:DUF1501 domain-containing protein [Lacipirellula limnantheis]|nr:DUF1501 domain-containing protein [Lacipirellula limnantheis]
MNHRRPMPYDRRTFLQRSGMGLGALGLAGMLGEAGLAPSAASAASFGSQPTRQHYPGKAKRVIHFFLNGGPSQVDTFDHKPMLAKYAGQPIPETLATERKTGAAFPSPFKFRPYGQSGIEVSDIFSRIGEHVDDIAVINSMFAHLPNHEPSLMLMNCGDSVQPRPSVGSWVLYGMGSENQNLPGFIALCPGGYPIKDAENWQAGFLPGAYQGTYIDTQFEEVERLIANIRSPHATTAMQRRQLDLLGQLNAEHRASRSDPRLDARIESFELAFRMQMAATDAFDLDREPQHIRELYGDGVNARQTLIARRLLERGVRYVQLWHGAGQPWDHHSGLEGGHRDLARQIDQPVAALLTDLKQRGMFDDTLVIFGGEFGRTPTVELGADGNSLLGRDHNQYGFTVWLAGGGVRGGTVHGATDDFGFKAVDQPTSVHDLHATILHLLGFDHERLTFRYAGRDFRLTDVQGQVIGNIVA